MSEDELSREALLAEIPWLEALARRLSADGPGRDDLVQETVHQALARPPRAAEGRSLRAWLCEVLRNAQRLGRRSRARTLERERESARPEAVEPVDELVARAELSRKLLDLVLGLDRRSREVLILRYYRGLGTAAIAAHLSCSEEVVRQRQSRALAQLREKTRDDGDLRDLLALGGYLPRVARGAGSVLRWSAAACLGIVAACLAPRLAGDPTSGHPGPPPAAPEGAPAAAVADSRGSEASASERSAAQASAADAPWLALAIRDARTHAPLAGATVSRARAKDWDELNADVEAAWSHHGIRGSAGSYLALAREEALPSEPGTEDQPPFAPKDESVVATADAEGIAALAAPLPSEEFLVVRAAGRGARSLAVAEVLRLAKERLEVDLHPVAGLPVRVHTLEGEAIEDAFLRLEAVPFLPQYRPQPFVPLVDGLAWHGPTDSAGTFEIAGVPLDEALIVTPLSRFIGKPADVLLPEGAPLAPLALVVVAPGGVSGRFVDSRGRALVGARVDCTPRRPWYGSWASTMTDEDGCFRLRALPSGPQELQCWPDYRGGYVAATDRSFPVRIEPFAQMDLGELVYDGGVRCEGRVAGLGPMRVGGVVRMELWQGSSSLQTGVGDDGSFHFLASARPGRLECVIDSDWSAGRCILAKTVHLPCEGVEFDVSPLIAALTFRVAPDGDATPIVGAHFYDHDRDDGAGIPSWEGAISRYDLEADGDSYTLRTLPPGRYRLELQGTGGTQSWVGDVELEAGKTRDLGTLALGTGTLRGSLTGATPDAVGSPVINIVRRVPGRFGMGAFGDDHFDRRSAPVAPDGSFQFEAIPAGLWCATAAGESVELVEGTLVDLRAGESRQVELRAGQAGRIRCRVRHGAVPVAGAVASYSFAEAGTLRPFFELNPRTRLLPSNAEGVIEMGTFFPGAYRILIGAGDTGVSRLVEVGWGEQLDLDFDLGATEFTLTLDLPEDWLEHCFRLDYRVLEEDPERTGLELEASRLDKRTFLLRAPPSNGYVSLSLQFGSRTPDVVLPLTLSEDQRAIVLALPPGEIVLRVGGEPGAWATPDVSVIELPGGKLEAAHSWFDTSPLEALPDGRWLARGIPDGATVRIQSSDQRLQSAPPPKLVHFESGRLELTWP